MVLMDWNSLSERQIFPHHSKEADQYNFDIQADIGKLQQ